MAEGDYVESLNGEEIITDFCVQIAEKLRRDCNLRETDSYQGGYSGKATIRLELYGMDTVTVETQVALVGNKPQGESFSSIDTEVEVAVEPALDQVRERSDQPIPTLTMEGGQEAIRPRRYVRRERVVGGGATGESV